MKKAFLAVIAVLMVFTVKGQAQEYIFGPGYYAEGTDPGYNIWQSGFWNFQSTGGFVTSIIPPVVVDTPEPYLNGQTLVFDNPGGVGVAASWTATLSTEPFLPALTPGTYEFSFHFDQATLAVLPQTFSLSIYTPGASDPFYSVSASTPLNLLTFHDGYATFGGIVLDDEVDYLLFELHLENLVSVSEDLVISEIAFSKKSGDPFIP